MELNVESLHDRSEMNNSNAPLLTNCIFYENIELDNSMYQVDREYFTVSYKIKKNVLK